MPSSSSVRIGAIVVLAAAGGALAYWRSHRTQEPVVATTAPHAEVEPSRTPDPARPTPVQVAQATPPRPELPPGGEDPKVLALANGSAATTPAEVFSVETRDGAWAPAIEAEIKDRMGKAPAKLATECRSAHCQLTLDGATEAVGKTIAMFESEKGLIGFADNIYLTKPELHDDGTTTVRAIASFTR